MELIDRQTIVYRALGLPNDYLKRSALKSGGKLSIGE
jgi:hypothetical protein